MHVCGRYDDDDNVLMIKMSDITAIIGTDNDVDQCGCTAISDDFVKLSSVCMCARHFADILKIIKTHTNVAK